MVLQDGVSNKQKQKLRALCLPLINDAYEKES